MNKYAVGVVVIVSAAFSIWWYIKAELPRAYEAKPSAGVKLPTIHIGENNIPVEIALDGKSREKGLSGRASLPENQGMLFVFPRRGIYRFWMPDMHFSIDIIWISDNKVIGVSENLLPETDLAHPKFYSPPEAINYALEVNAGFAKRKNIKVGDTATLY